MTETVKKIICSNANYRLSQAVDLIAPAVLLYIAVAAPDTDLALGALLLVAGFITWGFLEYTLHKYMYHGNTGIIQYGHAVHHVEPKSTIAMVFFIPIVINAGIYFAIAHFTGSTIAAFFVCGWASGYTYYSFFHVVEHFRIFKSKYYRTLQIHHDLHHVYPDKNYGVTTQFWDTLFRTKVKQ